MRVNIAPLASPVFRDLWRFHGIGGVLLVVVALFELHIEFAHSLKEKRMVVKSLRDKLSHHFKIATNEVALHDVHQQSRLAVSFITLEHAHADAMLDKIIDFIESHTDARLAGWTSEKLEFDPMAGLS